MQAEFCEYVQARAVDHGVPGVAVATSLAGAETYACYGVTSVENPLPVDRHTLFALGSVTKTFTATTLMRLEADGRIKLDAPVRHYVPEFELADEDAANKITVKNLLNHTAGLDWRVDADTGEGNDALALGVTALRKSMLIARPGSRASYSQAGYNLAGKIIEAATGLGYEKAVARLILEPLNLTSSFFDRDDVMTRRFAAGHNLSNGCLQTARPWKYSRGDNPGAGLASSVADQLRWCKFHLGGGLCPGGTRIVPEESLLRMRSPTVACENSSLGDWIGLSWFLREVDGVKIVEHGGSANGQFANLLVAPDHDFAVAVLSNAGPDGGLAFNREILHWALEQYLHVVDRAQEEQAYDAGASGEVVGTYQNEMMVITVRDEDAAITLECQIRPEIRVAAAKAPPPDLPPAGLSLLSGDDLAFVITSGGLKGQKCCFNRDATGVVTGVDLAGRFFDRVAAAQLTVDRG